MRGPQRRTEAEAWIGKTLDQRYKVQEILKEAGTHTVYVATHLRLRKQVAIKIIQPEFASDGDTAARFAREAMAGAQFDHPNVVGIIDCGRLPDGRTFLVTELVRGPSLQDFAAQHGRIHWTLACDIGAQIAEALVAAHSVGIVHRDVSPEHILLEVRDDGSYWAKLTNFGVSRMSGNALVDPGHELGSTLTRTGNILGTPGYVAPEQAVGEDVDEAADAYALGVIVWELINGRRLWQAATIEDALARQLHEVPGPLLPFEDGPIPESLALIVHQLLARDPRGRPRLIDPVATTFRKLAHGADFEESLVTAIPEVSAAMAEPDTAARYAPASVGDDDGAVAGGTIVADGFYFPTAPPASTSLKVVLGNLTQVLGGIWKSAAPSTRAVLGLVAASPLLLVVLVLALRGGGGDDRSSTEEAIAEGRVVSDAVARAVAAADAKIAAERAAANAPAKDAAPQTPAAGLPDELRPAMTLLFNAEGDEKGRHAAATRLAGVGADTPLPQHVRLGAELVAAGTCPEKLVALKKIRQLDDPAVLPILQALDRSGRKECGPKKKKTDCLGCMREDLARVVGRFEALAEVAGKS